MNNFDEPDFDEFQDSKLPRFLQKKPINTKIVALHNKNCAIHLEGKVIDAIKEFNYGLGYFGEITNSDALKLWFVGNKVLQTYGDTPAMYNQKWRTQTYQGTKPDNFGYKSWKVLDSYVRTLWSMDK